MFNRGRPRFLLGKIVKKLRNNTSQRSWNWHPKVSFWITASVFFLLILLSAVASGVAVVLIILGIFGFLTGLYTLVFKRISWAGISTRKVGATVAAGGLIVAIVGVAFAGSHPVPPKNQVVAVAGTSAASLPTATPTEPSPSLSSCATKDAAKQYQKQEFVCTLARDGKLVWMEKTASEKLTADLAAEKAATQQAAAEQAEAQRSAAEKAAEQTPVQEAPPPAAPAPAYVHPGAFCTGGTGVSMTGKPMVCAPGSDGRLRWQSQ